MIKKRIGISLRIVENTRYPESRDVLSHEWTQILEELNFVPIMIPNSLKNLHEFLNNIKIDGIILSGGDNIGDTPLRDKTELNLLTFGIEHNLPILGVCRGFQIINNFFEGDLIVTSNKKHVNSNHLIEIQESNFLEIINKKQFNVNSYHDNIISNETLSNSLIPIGVCITDKTIEICKHKTFPILCVMWHPERDINDINKIILKNFFD